MVASTRLAASPAVDLFLTYRLPSMQVLITAVNNVIGTNVKQKQPPTIRIMQLSAIWLWLRQFCLNFVVVYAANAIPDCQRVCLVTSSALTVLTATSAVEFESGATSPLF